MQHYSECWSLFLSYNHTAVTAFTLYNADVMISSTALTDCSIAVSIAASHALFSWLLDLSWAAKHHIVMKLNLSMRLIISVKITNSISVQHSDSLLKHCSDCLLLNWKVTVENKESVCRVYIVTFWQSHDWDQMLM